MLCSNRSKLQLSDEEKKKRRRKQKKMSMRRARAKLNATAIEERRQKDRERYLQKKQNGLIKTIKDFTPREQRQIRKIWREKSKIRRDKEKLKKRTEELLNENTPPTSPAPSTSRILTGREVSARNRRKLKAIPIDDKDVCEIQEIAADNNIQPFKGTFQVHQISWSALEPDLLHARRLSCISCAAHVKRPHYEIGQIKVQQGTTNSLESQSSPITLGRRRNSPMIASVTSSHVVPSSIHFNLARSMSASSSVTSPHSAVSVPVSQTSTPSSPAFNSSAPSTPTSSPRVLTPDASTITGSRTPTLPTPDHSVSTREPLTPRKKLNFGNNRSNSLSRQNKFKSVFDDFLNIDDSDENIFD